MVRIMVRGMVMVRVRVRARVMVRVMISVSTLSPKSVSIQPNINACIAGSVTGPISARAYTCK